MPDTPLPEPAPLVEAGTRPAFDNAYARLPERLFARLAPTPVKAPRLLRLNEALAERLGLDPAWLRSEAGIAMLAGNHLPPGAEPIAQAYAGHQFGHFVPSLGDGRAILLGEVVTPAGDRRDIQLKGSGPTPFSRRGDGRAFGRLLRASERLPLADFRAAHDSGRSVYVVAEKGLSLRRQCALSQRR